VAGTTDPGGRGGSGAGPRAEAPRAPASWSIPEIRVVKDDRGRLRIDATDPDTYGAYAARQFLATAEADPRFRDGMTKRPSAAAIRITYDDGTGTRREVGVREIFCRMEGDALVLTQFEDARGVPVKDLPIAAPPPVAPVAVAVADEVEEEDDDEADRLHQLALAELGVEPGPPVEAEPAPEEPPPPPARERRRPTGPLRQYGEAAEPAPSARAPEASAAPVPAASPAPPPRGVAPTPTPLPAAGPGPAAVRALSEAEAAALRALIEAKAGESRWANGLLMQAGARHPGDRRLQNEHLANLLRISLDTSRAESRTPLAAALRSVLEEVHAYKAGVLARDPLKADRLALQPFARVVLEPPPPIDDGPMKTVSGAVQRTPAQVLAKLEDPKLARASRVKLLLEVVPELIEGWRPDKESGHSEAANENSPAVVRRLFNVANAQRQQRKFIDDGVAFKKANERYAGLEGRLPKAPPADES
jgi:hypothetical protein